MYQRTNFGGTNPQPGFDLNKTGNDANQFGQNLFDGGLNRPNNTFNTSTFSQNKQPSTGFGFGTGIKAPQQPTFVTGVQSNTFGTNNQIPAFGTTGHNSTFGSNANQQQLSRPFGQTNINTITDMGLGQQNSAQRPQQSAFGLGGDTTGFQINSGIGVDKPFDNMRSNIFSIMGGITTTTTNAGTANPPYTECIINEPGSSNGAGVLVHICSKEPYNSWSIEELRWKDYQVNRKPQPNQPGLNSNTRFGTNQNQQSIFGMNANTSSFNTFNKGQQQGNNLTSAFGNPSNTGLASGTGLGGLQQHSNLVGDNSGMKPGNTGMSVFGNMNNNQHNMNMPSFNFGSQNQNGSTFGTSTNQTSGLGSTQNILNPSFPPVGNTIQQQSTPSFGTSSFPSSTFQSSLGSSSQSNVSQKNSLLAPTQQNSHLQSSTSSPLNVNSSSSLINPQSGIKPPVHQSQSLFGGISNTGTGLFGNILNTDKRPASTFGQDKGLFSLNSTQNTTAPSTSFGSGLNIPSSNSFLGTQQPQQSFTGLQNNYAPSFGQNLQPQNKFSLFGQPNNSISLSGNASTLNQPSLSNTTPLFSQQPSKPNAMTMFFGSSQVPQNNKLLTPTVDNSPFGVFDMNFFPLKKPESKLKQYDISSGNPGCVTNLASKIAGRYFSNIKIGSAYRNDTKLNHTSLPRIITPRDYAMTSSEPGFGFRRAHQRLVVKGLNTKREDKINPEEHADSQKENSGVQSKSVLKYLVNNPVVKEQTDAFLNSDHFGIGGNPEKPDSVVDDPDRDIIMSLPFESEFVLPNGEKETLYRPKFKPSLSELSKMRDEELTRIKNFKIWADDAGSITFLESINLFDLTNEITVESLWKKLNEIVKFMNRIISVYPPKSKKHPRGKGLNVKAEISLKGCTPKEEHTSNSTSASDIENDVHLRSLKKANGTKFKNYNCDTGTWTFTVDHFTTYGFGVRNHDGNVKTGIISEDVISTETHSFKGRKAGMDFNSEFYKLPLMEKPGMKPSIKKDDNARTELNGETKLNPLERSLSSDGKEDSGVVKKKKARKEMHDDEETHNYNQTHNDNEKHFRNPKKFTAYANGSKQRSSGFNENADTDSHFESSASDTSSKKPIFQKIEDEDVGMSSELHCDSRRQFRLGLSSILPEPSIHFTNSRMPPDEINTEEFRCNPMDESNTEVEIRKCYSHNIKQNIIDLSSSNRGMFGAAWGPGGTLIIPVRKKKEFLDSLAISKVNHLGKSVCSESTEDRKSIIRMYELLLDKTLGGCTILNYHNPRLEKIEKSDVSPFDDSNVELNRNNRQISSLSSLESTASMSSVSAVITNKFSQKEYLDPKIVPRMFYERMNFKVFEEILRNEFNDIDDVTSNSHYFTQVKNVISLASVLFDPLPECLISKLKFHRGYTYLCESIRRHEFSSWLVELANKSLNDKLKAAKRPQDKILAYMVSGQINKAIELAIEYKFFRLASIMTQLSGTFGLKLLPKPLPSGNSDISCVYKLNHLVYGCRGMDASVSYCISRQVHEWNNCNKKAGVKNYSSHVDLGIENIWSLCSGRAGLWHSSIFSNIKDWKNAMALFFWYGGLCSWGIPEALSHYEESYKKYSDIASPYAAIDHDEHNIIIDPCYLLLELYSNSNVDLSSVFDPSNYSRNALDCIIPWLLCIIILNGTINIKEEQDHRLYVPKFGQDSNDLKKIFHFLSLSLIDTLEGIGLWKWSLFVSLFVENDEERKSLVMSILMRNYPYEDSSGSSFSNFESEARRYTASIFGEPRKMPHKDSQIYKFITETLCIPPVWIHDARALRSFHEGDCPTFTISQMDSGMFFASYQSIISGNFVSSVILEDTRLVSILLDVLDSRVDIPYMKNKINNLQKCLHIIDDYNDIEKVKSGCILQNFPPDKIYQYRDHLRDALAIFSRGVTPDIVTAIRPFNKDDALYDAINTRFSLQHVLRSFENNTTLQDARYVHEKIHHGISICMSIIYEKAVEMFFTLQKLYPKDFWRDDEKKALSSLITFVLPYSPGSRVQNLMRLVSNDISLTRLIGK